MEGNAKTQESVISRHPNVHFSSQSSEWETPQALFDEYDRQYGFTLDVCASHENAKCDFYCTQEGTFFKGIDDRWGKHDGLSMPWIDEICWMNPPYGREIGAWVGKAASESKNGALVVALLPARTDTRWFHEWIYNKENVSIEFLKGRLKFGRSKNSAPFPSMICVFSPPSPVDPKPIKDDIFMRNALISKLSLDKRL